MIPHEYVGRANLATPHGEGKLVAVPRIRKEHEVVEGHVQRLIVAVQTETLIVVRDPRDGPNEAQAVLPFNPVGFA